MVAKKSLRNLKKGSGEKIVVGMSGGIDSSAALILLKRNGWNPIGVSLKYCVWNNKLDARENTCCTFESVQRAKKVCAKYGCEHKVIDVGKEFYETVIKYFIEAVEKSQTPNPCMVCNREAKFLHLFKFADSQGIRYVATGHYAKIAKKSNSLFLSAPKDKAKDQTYYLSLLPREWLERIIFPLGEITKTQVYNMVKKERLNFYLKLSQSQDLCFVSEKSMDKFLEKEVKSKPGNIKNEKGKIIGKHKGLKFYTVGQRKKIGLPGGPFYVVTKNPKGNELVVSGNREDLGKKEIDLNNIFFSDEKMYGKELKVKVKIRYQQEAFPAVILPNKKDFKTCRIQFKTPQTALAPGQYAVFYVGDLCVGSGVIV